MSRSSVPVLALALGLIPTAAQAVNGLRPRTPADFTDVPCLQTATKGDAVHIEYSVAYDDTELTADELPDSRRMQFFAFAQPTFDFRFPVWVNQSDYDRSEANGDIAQEYGPDDILESSSRWPAGTWVRITPDDARVPITIEQAAMGVTWDTTDVAPGTWLVAAYTWEPEQNLWSPRFGALRIEDPADPDAAGPTVFLPRVDGLLAMRGEPLPIDACVQAPAGSTLTASWGTIAGGVDEPTWVPFLEDEPVESGELSLDFVAPAETGSAIKLRLEITDPDGRRYVAFSPTTIAVTGEIVESDDDGGGEGCGCRSNPAASPALVLIAALGLRLRRRRR